MLPVILGWCNFSSRPVCLCEAGSFDGGMVRDVCDTNGTLLAFIGC